MNFDVEDKAFIARFQDEVVPKFPEVPVDYIGSRASALNGLLIRFRVKRAASRNTAVGGKTSRNYGSVLVQITTPSNEGSARFMDMANAASAAFRNYRANGSKIKCFAPGLLGPDDDGAFITGTVDIPFQSEYSV